jgi:hypothetical protein
VVGLSQGSAVSSHWRVGGADVHLSARFTFVRTHTPHGTLDRTPFIVLSPEGYSNSCVERWCADVGFFEPHQQHTDSITEPRHNDFNDFNNSENIWPQKKLVNINNQNKNKNLQVLATSVRAAVLAGSARVCVCDITRCQGVVRCRVLLS